MSSNIAWYSSCRADIWLAGINHGSGRSRFSQTRGTPNPKGSANLLFGQISPKTAWKIGPRRGVHPKFLLCRSTIAWATQGGPISGSGVGWCVHVIMEDWLDTNQIYTGATYDAPSAVWGGSCCYKSHHSRAAPRETTLPHRTEACRLHIYHSYHHSDLVLVTKDMNITCIQPDYVNFSQIFCVTVTT